MEGLRHIQKLEKNMKSGYKIDWADEASNNLDSIIEYLQIRWSYKEIRIFFKKLDKRLDVISKNPLAYPGIELDSNIRRSVLTEQTTIYYEIQSDVIVILSLFDNRKDPDSIKI
jgi:plasmid stabilization system protein ParE